MKTIPSAQALEIAGISRTIFNQIVSDGFYNCAPPARHGAAREFTFDQMVPLVIVGQFLLHGMKARTAGMIACSLDDMRDSQPPRTWHIGGNAAGEWSIWRNGPRNGPNLVSIVVDIGAIRDFLNSKCDWSVD